MRTLGRTSTVAAGLAFALASPLAAESPAPRAVVLSSLDWRDLTNVPVGEGSLLALEHDPAGGKERIRITEPDYVKRVAEHYRRLVPESAPQPPDDFRILALLVWRDGTSARIAVPRSCSVMTRDGKPVAFDRELYDLLVSRLGADLRGALGGACAAR
jgi:hypothetical protein